MNLSKVAIATGLVVAALGAQATVRDLGVHAAFEATFLETPDPLAVGFLPFQGLFSDAYLFELLTAQTVTSTVASINQGPNLVISNGTYFVLSAGDDQTFSTADDVFIPPAPYTFDGTTGSTSHALVLGAGKYAYVVQGNVTGTGGFYSLVSEVSPVPEPQTWALMLAGVGGLLSLAKRRRS